MTNFLLGSGRTDAFECLLQTLQKCPKDQSSRSFIEELITQACHNQLTQNSPKANESLLGPIAVAAWSIADTTTFRNVVRLTDTGLDEKSISALGEMVCIPQLVQLDHE